MADTPNDKDKEWLALARAAHSESTTYFDSGIRAEIERDIRQFQSRHPQQSKYELELFDKRSKYFSPKTRAAIRRSEAKAAAALFSNSDVVTLDPEDQDDKLQVAGAKLVNELLNMRLQRSLPWFLITMGAYQDARTVGVCVSYQYWLYNEKRKIDKPCVDLIPIENFRFSPSASWHDVIGTSPYLVELIPMYVKDVRARTKASGLEGQPKWRTLTDAEILAAAQKTQDSIKLARDHGRADANQGASEITDFSIVYVHRNIIEKDGEDWIYETLGTEVMLTDPQLLEKRYFHGMRPYAMGFTIVESHKVYPSGLPRLTRSKQEEVNDWKNTRMDALRLAVNKRWFARRGAQVDVRSITRNIAGSVTLVNDIEKDVKEVEFRDVAPGAFKEAEILNAEFDELSGTFSPASVDANRKLGETVGGLEMLSSDANELELYALRVFAETWLKPVLRQLVLLEQYYETDERLLALAAKAASVTDDGVDVINDRLMMTPIHVAVHVGIGATSPQVRLSQFLFALKSLNEILESGALTKAGLDIEEVVAEVFGKLGYDSGARFFEWGEQDPQVIQLQSQIQELEDALKRKDPPEIVAEKVKLIQAQTQDMLAKTEKTKAEKVKIGVESTFGAMQAAEVVAAVPAVAPVADVIMRAAGYVEPTPPGIDPGFAPGDQAPGQAVAPVQAAAGLSVQPVTNKRTGVGFTPGGAPPAGADRELPAGVPHNTNPLTPKPLASPASPMTGENAGIETMRGDTEGPAR